MRQEVKNNKLIESIKSAQYAIIRNLNTLDEETRSKIFSRFNKIKYYTLTDEDRNTKILQNAAAFVRGDNMYFFVNKEDLLKDEINVSIHHIVHESNHALSGNGVMDIYPSCNTLKPATVHNMGINEAMTEFFAQEFYPEKFCLAYMWMTHIAALLCKECGYEKMKELYFKGERVNFEDHIVKEFGLPDTYLVGKLFEYMDLLFEAYMEDIGKQTPKINYLITKCYQTLCTMKLYKINNAVSKTISDKDLCLKKSLELFDIGKFIKQEDYYIFSNRYIDYIVYNLNQNKELFLKGKVKKLDDIYQTTCFESFYHMIMRNGNLLSNLDKELAIEDLNTLRKNKDNMALDMLHEAYREHNSDQVEGIEFQKPEMINSLLNFLADENGKVNLSQYSNLEISEIVGLTLFGKYKLSYEDVFKHFTTQDIAIALNTKELQEIFKYDMLSLLSNKEFIKCGLKNNLNFHSNKDIVEKVKQELEEETKEKTFIK